MSKDYSFLAYLINEDIYHIPPKPEEHPGESSVPENEKTLLSKEEHNVISKDESDFRKIEFSGKNLKQILVLFDQRDQKLLNEKDETFLKKVLMAVDINFDDIALINLAGLGHDEVKSTTMIPHKLRLCFMEKLPEVITLPGLTPYENIQYDGKQILWCGTLQSISENKEMKVKLWQQLKFLFHK